MRIDSPIVINVPHSSLYIPEEEMQYFDRTKLIRELLVMTDHCCDDLYDAGFDMVSFPVSRLVCDFERFRDDEEEIMSGKGMGAVYTHASDLCLLRKVSKEHRERILRRYYDPYHKMLEDIVTTKLNLLGKCLIVDGHSFYEEPLPYENEQHPDRAGICIGADEYHTPEDMTRLLRTYFNELGYSVSVNNPFAGALVPIRYYHHNKCVFSVMIEINRRLYIDREGRIKPSYSKVKADIAKAMELLNEYMEGGILL